MNSFWAVLLILATALLSAVSQLMLKRSADLPHKNVVREYLNILVVGAYAIMFFNMIVNMVALAYLPLKVVTAIGTASYVIVILLSRLALREKIGAKKLLGMALIIAGILVFTLFD